MRDTANPTDESSGVDGSSEWTTRRAMLAASVAGAAAIAGCGGSGNGGGGNGGSGNGGSGNGGGNGGSGSDGTTAGGGGMTTTGGGGTISGRSVPGSIDNSQPSKLEVLSHSATAATDKLVVRMEAKNVAGETRSLVGYGVWAELHVEERENPILRKKFRKSGLISDGERFEVSVSFPASDIDRATDFSIEEVDSYTIAI